MSLPANDNTDPQVAEIAAALLVLAQEDELSPIAENHENEVTFNVMPGKPVKETVFVKEYRVGPRYIEATFDREYESSMDKSPSHLIFLTGLVHTQKLLYALLCHEFGIDYDPNQPESIKIWPTKLDIDLPRMVRKSKDIVQRLWLTDIEKKSETEYRVKLHSKIENQITFSVECAVYRIR